MEKQTKIKQTSAIKVTPKTYPDFQISEEGKLIHTVTGEIIDLVDIIIAYRDLSEKLHKKLSRDFYFNKWQGGNKFSKIYQVKTKHMIKGLSLQAKGLLFVMTLNLKQTVNEVVIEGKRPTNKMLSDSCGVSERVIKSLLSELDKANIIKLKGNTSSRIILLNPYVCFNGSNLLKATLQVFYKDV